MQGHFNPPDLTLHLIEHGLPTDLSAINESELWRRLRDDPTNIKFNRFVREAVMPELHKLRKTKNTFLTG